MLQRSIQSVSEPTSNECYSVGSRASWSCLKRMLQRSIQSVLELTSNECYSVGSRASWSCLKWMLQRSTHSVLGVTWNGCHNVTCEKDVVTDCHSCKTILSRLWNYCACHVKRGGVTFAPALGSRSPLPPTWVGASATPHEVGANATPLPTWDTQQNKTILGFIKRWANEACWTYFEIEQSWSLEES